jgi:hypothetical protein
MLPERKVAGAGVQDDIDSAFGQFASGSIRHPGVFADFKADPHIADFEQQVAERQRLPGNLHLFAGIVRPSFEPARFVMDPFAGQVLLGHQPQQFAVNGHRRRVEQGSAM